MSGTFILSLDTEIAWGTDPENLSLYASCFNHYRPLIDRLIALLDQYQIPATWAVVGHLFLQPDDPRSLKRDSDWPDWYHAPDVVEAIRAARLRHEIGTHTFSHLYTTDRNTTREVWQADLKMAKAIHEQHGLKMLSLVYPRDLVAYTDVLPEYGIIAYRGAEESWYRAFPRSLKRPSHLLDRFAGLPPPTYDLAKAQVGGRLVNLPASQILMDYMGIRRRIPTSARVRQARMGLARAAQREHLFHLWFHPFNLGTSEAMFGALEDILAEVARRRDAGQIRVMTMQEAAQVVLSGENK